MKKKITKFIEDSGWFKCKCCGGFHQYTGFYLDGKSVPIKTQYFIGMGWMYPCLEILDGSFKVRGTFDEVWDFFEPYLKEKK